MRLRCYCIARFTFVLSVTRSQAPVYATQQPVSHDPAMGPKSCLLHRKLQLV